MTEIERIIEEHTLQRHQRGDKWLYFLPNIPALAKDIEQYIHSLRLSEEEVCKALKSVPSGSEMVDFAKAICELQRGKE